ncbi:hypothetical protein EON62_05245 [archaeon]|nr:MAG: hypothetical protein EON62_05245 [archaeon]
MLIPCVQPTVLRKGTGKAAVSTAVKDNSSAAGMFAPPRAAPAGPPGGGMGGGPVRGPAMPPPGGRMGGGPAAGGMASYDGGYDQYDAGLPVQRRGSSGPMGAPVSRYAQQPAASVGGGGYSGGGGGMPAPSRGARPAGGYSAAGYDAPAESYGYGRDYGTGGFPSSLPVSGRASIGGGGYTAAPSSSSAYPGRGGPGGQSAYATYTSRDGSGPAPPGARAGSASRYAGSAPGYR